MLAAASKHSCYWFATTGMLASGRLKSIKKLDACILCFSYSTTHTDQCQRDSGGAGRCAARQRHDAVVQGAVRLRWGGDAQRQWRCGRGRSLPARWLQITAPRAQLPYAGEEVLLGARPGASVAELACRRCYRRWATTPYRFPHAGQRRSSERCPWQTTPGG